MQLTQAGNQPTKGNSMSDLTINLNSNKTSDTVDVTFKDAAGNVTTHHGVLTVASSDALLFNATVADDNSHVVVTSNLGVTGTGTLTVTDAADNIVATATVIVDAGEAVSLSLSDADSEAAANVAQQPAPTGDAPGA
jgi:glyceraldehyde-3-phosphate dehydrogenase/erythrose-4-phosphate dehydrogenase